LSYFVNTQTNRQTNKQTNKQKPTKKHNLLGGGNKLLRSQYNKIVQRFELDLRKFGIKYNTFITVMPKCT